MKNNLFTYELGEIILGMQLEDGSQRGDEYIRAGRSNNPDHLTKIYLKRKLTFEKKIVRSASRIPKNYVTSGRFFVEKNTEALMLVPDDYSKNIFVLIKYRNCELHGGALPVRKDLHKFKTEYRNELYFLIEMPPASGFTCWGIDSKQKRTIHYSDFISAVK